MDPSADRCPRRRPATAVQSTAPDVPFTVSPAAEAHLRELIRYVAEAVPETAGLIPILCRGRCVTTWTWEGASARPDYSDEDYYIGYYRPEQAADWPRMRVAGTDLAASRDTLERLRGLHLDLAEKVEGDPLSGRVVGRRS